MAGTIEPTSAQAAVTRPLSSSSGAKADSGFPKNHTRVCLLPFAQNFTVAKFIIRRHRCGRKPLRRFLRWLTYTKLHCRVFCAQRRGKNLNPLGTPSGFVTQACEEGSRPHRARARHLGAQMDVQHRSDIRIDHQGIALILAVAILVLVLTIAALWIGLR